MVSKQHFIRAAAMVRAIRAGEWTAALPQWAPYYPGKVFETIHEQYGNVPSNEIRAIQTAEAFTILFSEGAPIGNPRFDQACFLHACGFGPKPIAKRKTA